MAYIVFNGSELNDCWDCMVNVLECYHVYVEDMVLDLERLYTNTMTGRSGTGRKIIRYMNLYYFHRGSIFVAFIYMIMYNLRFVSSQREELCRIVKIYL